LQDFESGKFEETRKKRRSKKETTKFVYTYDELQTMLRAGAFTGAKVCPVSSSDDDDSDSDDDVSKRSKPPLRPLLTTKEDTISNLRQTRLNFNYVFRECPKEEQVKYGDLTGDDYFIEEDFEEVNILEDSKACEQLMKEAEGMDVDEMNDDDDDTFQESLPETEGSCQ
jgi:hypothetical protein